MPQKKREKETETELRLEAGNSEEERPFFGACCLFIQREDEEVEFLVSYLSRAAEKEEKITGAALSLHLSHVVKVTAEALRTLQTPSSPAAASAHHAPMWRGAGAQGGSMDTNGQGAETGRRNWSHKPSS